uniref:Late embryogenesis abundant type 2 dehydrin-like protein n=1 Tax=Pseudotsuga menziesii var. menziesii TaxID=278161 RepID=Q5MDW0_PSEMZ|nr:late embryogenesis abundant type 2 dehydrin-like protein [Pseudotsuga menziesii var. menziesii]
MAEYQDRGHTQTEAARHNTNEKAGLLDKIKQMLPGGQTQTQSTAYSHPTQKPGSQAQAQAQTGYSNSNQKPGMVDKIKAKIPGLH